MPWPTKSLVLTCGKRHGLHFAVDLLKQQLRESFRKNYVHLKLDKCVPRVLKLFWRLKEAKHLTETTWVGLFQAT